MDMTEEEKAERELRQKRELERRIKTRNSRIFLLLGSVFEIIVSVIIIFALIILFAFLIFRAFKLPEATAGTVLLFCFIVSVIGGLFAGFMIYKNFANFIIEKFNLYDKLSNEILGHYSKRYRKEQEEGLKK